MKAPLLLFSLFIFSFSFAQESTDSAEQYCLIRIYERGLSNKVEVAVDSGQHRRQRIIGEEMMRDKETNRKMVFVSEVSALNFFGAAGWKLLSAFPVVDGKDVYTRYLFKKTGSR